jgi:DNA replication protein DnaC
MNDALAAKLKYLHLGGLLSHWDDYLKLAGEERFSHGRLLTHIVEEEYRLKREHLRDLRLQKARVPEPWAIETFPFERQPKLNEKKLMALYDSLTYMLQRQNIIWLGGTGVGKTGLATSFLIQAINQGYSGRYVLFIELLAQLSFTVKSFSSGMPFPSG